MRCHAALSAVRRVKMSLSTQLLCLHRADEYYSYSHLMWD